MAILDSTTQRERIDVLVPVLQTEDDRGPLLAYRTTAAAGTRTGCVQPRYALAGLAASRRARLHAAGCADPFRPRRKADELLRQQAGGERFQMGAGASGSGRCSLVGADLLPRLADNAIEGARDWPLPQAIPARDEGRVHWVGLRFILVDLCDNPSSA